MGELMPFVDVCIANEEDLSDVFGIHAGDSDIEGGSLDSEGYRKAAQEVAERFRISHVAVTLRKSLSASRNLWSGMLYGEGKAYFSREYDMQIVDRVGGGDSFGGGLIYSCLQDMAPQDIIEFAVAASCLKHSIEGDFNQVSVDEVMKLAGGDASGRVQR